MDMDLTPTLLKWSETNRPVRWLLKLGWLHEGCHYLAARAVGVRVVRVAQTEILHEEDAPWRMAVICLAPAAVGMAWTIGMVALSFVAATHAQEILFKVLANLGLLWLAACQSDLLDIWTILKSVRSY